MNRGVMRWPSSQRLVVGYALAFALLIVNAVVTFWNLRSSRRIPGPWRRPTR